MKISLLHYWLTNMRGGENVLDQLCHIWPDADIFTHACNPDILPETIRSHNLKTTFIDKLPGAKNNCQKYLPMMPSALKKLDLGDYDLIISSESGPIKGIRKPQTATHICYCHTPMRYLWDMYEEYFRNTSITGKAAMMLFKNYLRKYDLASADSVDHFIANSNFVAERIKRIYGRDSTVIYPPVNSDFFSEGDYEKNDYYLFVGQLIPYKQPKLAIDACRRLDRRLIVVGDGTQRRELETVAGARITFAGRASGEKLRGLYAGARALLFPGVEDFGIVPLEAQAAGTPVIALRAGGAKETVIDGSTGLFFDTPDVDALSAAIEEFEKIESSFLPDVMIKHATSFSEARFRAEIRQFVEAKISGH